MDVKTTLKSDEESIKRAELADAINRAGDSDPLLPADEEKKVEIDPAAMHALMIVVVKGAVLRIDNFLGWKQHPDDPWYDATTQALEMVMEKYLGTMATSPEAALAFQIGMGWVLPNLLAAKPAGEVVKFPDDFSKLSDLDLDEMVNAPLTSVEQRRKAMAELDRRTVSRV